MIYDYVNTKPPLDEELLSEYGIIEHGWLRDQAASVHKYVKRWRNAAGKWVYQYKQNVADKQARQARKEWIFKGVKKAYKQRKDQIATARDNATTAFRKNAKAQYNIRKKQVQAARKNASDIYTAKKKAASEAALNSYYARRKEIEQARKNKRKRRTSGGNSKA